jgi:anti-anti-sigma factor
MELTTTRAGEVVVITINGPRLDRSNYDLFKRVVGAHVRPGAKIALDLQEVHHVDGPGCGAVLALHRETAALGGEVKIFSLRQPVRTLFQRLHLHRRVPTYNGGDEALRSFEVRI